MKRIKLTERPDWREKAKAAGFHFAHEGGTPYWDETACLSFTLDQIERGIEQPTAELHAMGVDLAQRAAGSQELMEKLGVPDGFRDYVAASLRKGEESILGRMDLAVDGASDVKLLEYNADTPTSLYEAAVQQWTWLDEAKALGIIPADADQFNSIHDKLIAAYGRLHKDSILHFTCFADSTEDFGTVAYMMDCALQAGQKPKFLDIFSIGIDTEGRFTDQDSLVIDRLSKLYAWEWMFGDEFGANMPKSGTQFIEPPWKAMLSTKAILPLLWELHEGHPNLLPAYFDGDERAKALTSFVRKPIFSREGANTVLVVDGSEVARTDGAYGEGRHVIQQAAPLFQSEGGYAVIGSWIVDGQPAGIGVREDSSAITRNVSRFLPHIIGG